MPVSWPRSRPSPPTGPTTRCSSTPGSARTAPWWSRRCCSSAVGVADADLPFFPTRPEVLADLRAEHGSVAAYLTGAGGLDVAVLDALAGALLDLSPTPRLRDRVDASAN